MRPTPWRRASGRPRRCFDDARISAAVRNGADRDPTQYLAAAKSDKAVAGVEGVQGVRELRIRWIGHTLRAEADITVGAELTVKEAHDLAHDAERHLWSTCAGWPPPTCMSARPGCTRATKGPQHKPSKNGRRWSWPG